MILLLGASGYMGQAFATELRRRRHSFIPLTRKAIDYTDFELLFDYIRKLKPEFIINAAGYPGKPNVDACESAREETLFANTLLPQTISRACSMTSTPWGHVSSSCIYTGAKLISKGGTRIIKDSELRKEFEENPENICGYTEWDEPNFSFNHPPCNFYSGTKVLAEEAIRDIGQVYLWRPGMPFNHRSEPRNFLWRIQNYSRVFNGLNSLSHLEDFIRASLDLWERQAPYGIYNMTNPGAVLTRQVIEMVQRILRPNRRFEFWRDEEEFYEHGARALRSNCVMDVSKLLVAGIRMRSVEEALEDALRNWNVASVRANGLAPRNVSLLSS